MTDKAKLDNFYLVSGMGQAEYVRSNSTNAARNVVVEENFTVKKLTAAEVFEATQNGVTFKTARVSPVVSESEAQ